MSKETAVNVLIGTMLVSIFAIIVAACFGAIALAFYGLDLAVKHFFPGITGHWDIAFYAFISLTILSVSAGQMRRRLWTNAFLYLVAVVTILIPLLLNPQPHHVSAGLALRFPVAWFVALLLPRNSSAPRNGFFACALILTLAFADNAGLLGSGILSTVVEIGLLIAVVSWVFIGSRDGRYGWASTELRPARR